MLWTLSFSSTAEGFNGEIHREVHNDFSPKHEKLFLMSPNRFPPIERYQLTNAKYTIHDDTLIVEHIDGFGELSMVTVQIGDKVYTNSGDLRKVFSTSFKDVSAFDHEMDLVRDWKEIELNKIRGNNKSTVIEITTSDIKRYSGMKKKDRTFSEIFYKGALIIEQRRLFRGSTRVMKNTHFEEKIINCKVILGKYNFSL